MIFSNITLLSDLDGTLLDSHIQVSEQNRLALQYFMENGGRFGVCTGRNRQNACALLPGLPLNGPCIFSNGSMLYDVSGDRLMESRKVEASQLVPFIRLCMEKHPSMGVHLHTVLDSYFLSDPEKTDTYVYNSHQPCDFRKMEELMGETWIKLMLHTDATQKAWVLEQVPTLCQTLEVDFVESSAVYMEFLPKHSNKGTMVRHLRTLLPEDTTLVGVGDFFNDVEFIKEVDVGIYTENAPDQLKQTADYICAHHDNHPLADVVHRILPQLSAVAQP